MVGSSLAIPIFLLILRAEYVAVVHPVQNTNATLQSKNNIHMKTKSHIINCLASGYHKSERRIAPPHSFCRHFLKCFVLLASGLVLGACKEDILPITENSAKTSTANIVEAEQLMSQLEGIGTWQLVSVLEKIGQFTIDLAMDGMKVCFAEGKAVFTQECILVGTDDKVFTETLGEYSVDYVNGHILYIGGEEFDISMSDDGTMTLKSEKIILIISH